MQCIQIQVLPLFRISSGSIHSSASLSIPPKRAFMCIFFMVFLHNLNYFCESPYFPRPLLLPYSFYFYMVSFLFLLLAFNYFCFWCGPPYGQSATSYAAFSSSLAKLISWLFCDFFTSPQSFFSSFFFAKIQSDRGADKKICIRFYDN